MELEDFIRESIVDPNAYRAPGTTGEMPPFPQIPAGELDQLVQYLAENQQ
jgi:hypothetical protein